MTNQGIESTLKELDKLNYENFRAVMNFFLGELINRKNKKEIDRLLSTALKTPIIIEKIELDLSPDSE